MSAIVLRTPIIVGTNENLTASFRFWQDDAKTVPVSLSGFTASFGMRSSLKTAGADLGATLVSGEVVVQSPNTVAIDIVPDRLDDLPAGKYDFEVVLIAADGKRNTKLRGTISLKEGIAP